MTPFIVRAYQPGRIEVAYFVDLVSFGALFFHGERASPRAYTGILNYLVYDIPSPNKRANLRGLATVQYNDDLAARVEAALSPIGWTFERVPQNMADRGRLGGRPRAVSDETLDAIKADLKSAGQSDVARRYGLKPATLSNILRRDRQLQGNTNA